MSKTYTRDEVYQSTLEHYKGDYFATDVFLKKYALKDDNGEYVELNPSDMHKRIASEFVRIEQKYENPLSYDEIYELLAGYWVIPQGSPLSGIGNNAKIQSLSNCFVIEPPHDSYGGICLTDQQQIQIMKRRGGVGFDISTIRPKGLKTANAAITTDGIGVFMERYSNSTREVAQNGRRGALLLSISCHHYELDTFINIKKDLTKVTGANISIRLSDDFLNAVEKNEKYQQCWPVDGKPIIERWVDAREVWNQIIDSAYKSAEPGIFFWDSVLKNTPADVYADKGFRTSSTNPCLTGDTLVAVADGRNYVSLEQLAIEGKDVHVYAYENSTGKLTIKKMRNPRLTGTKLPVYKVTIEGGHTFRATGNHKMVLRDGARKSVETLVPGDQLWTAYKVAAKFNKKNRDVSCVKDLKKQGYHVEIIKDKIFVHKKCEHCGADFLTSSDTREIAYCSSRCSITHHNKINVKLSVKQSAQLHNRRVVSIELCSYEDVYNGTVDDEHTFCIAVGEENNAKLLLASQNCGELPLNPTDSCRLLVVNLYKFVQEPFTANARFNASMFAHVVQAAQRLMDDLVDLELEKIDTIISKITEDKEPEYVKAIELNLWKDIRKTTAAGRRTGLGPTGLGDCLAALNIRYGSEESINKTEELYKLMAINAYVSSIQMAKERGMFEVCDPMRERSIKHEYLDRIWQALPEQSREDFMKYGRRNIALTTTSPCGSISALAKVSSGIEPAIFLSGIRRRKINPNEVGVKVDYVDNVGDSWQEYKWLHQGFLDWQNATGLTDVADSSYHNATALDKNMNWRNSIRLQAAAQRWVCHSISKTLNMPSTSTKEEVYEAYMTAWKLGCKGFTVYVDGSRSGVLIKDDEEKKTSKQETTCCANLPPRPKKLACDILRAKVVSEGNSQTYMVLVGKKNDQPYEIFCGLSKHVEIPKKVNKGFIIKNGKKNNVASYNLHVDLGDDYIVFKDIVEQFANPNYGAFSRVLSLSLRHGIPLQFIVEQLQKDKNSELLSFNKAIARVLKEYIPNGTKYTGEKNCPECGSSELIYSEGCMKCQKCSYERCG